MQQKQDSPPLVMSLCAPQDQQYLELWEKHLHPLEQARHLTVWSAQHLLPGTTRQQSIEAHLDQAKLIVLMLSADFFHTNDCMTWMDRALSRQKNEGVHVVPLLLRSVMWHQFPLASLSCLPKNGRPVTLWPDPDAAFVECVRGIQCLLGLPTTDPIPNQQLASTVEGRGRARMLRRLRYNYQEMLANSLLGVAWLELDLAEKPDAVQNPAQHFGPVSSPDERILPSGFSIWDAYNKKDRELLILGEPGAGKSTLLLDLARLLVQQAERDEECPLPVILSLSSWAVKHLPLQDWIAGQFSQFYNVPHRLSEQWVRENKILPLLDGLDEIAEEKERADCIAAINNYHNEHLLVPLVVCSRKAEYEATSQRHKLILQTAIVVRPLTPEQVDAYFLHAGEALTALRSTLEENSALRALATNPLMLNVLLLTYQGTTMRELPEKEEQLQQRVWKDYIKRMVGRKGNTTRYPLSRMYEWLSWLARQMRERNQSVFYLEHLQPDWLALGQSRTYARLAVRLPAILIGVIASLGITLFFSFTDVTSLILCGVLGGFLGWMFSEGSLPGQPQEHEYLIGPRVAQRHAHSARSGSGGSLAAPLFCQTSDGAGDVSVISQKSERASEALSVEGASRCATHGIGKRIAISIMIGLLVGLRFGLSLSSNYGPGDWLRDGSIDGVVISLSSLLLQFLSQAISRHVLFSENSVQQRWKWFIRFIQTVHRQRASLVAAGVGLTIGLSTWLREGLSFGSSTTLRIGLSTALGTGIREGLLGWLSFGLVSILISLILEMPAEDAHPENVHLIDHLSWTWRSLMESLQALKHVRTTLWLAGTLALSVGVSYGVSYGLDNGLNNGLGVGLSVGLGNGSDVGLSTELGVGLSYWILWGLSQSISNKLIKNQDRRVPNQGIRDSFRNCIRMGIIGGTVIGTMSMLSICLSLGLSLGPNYVLSLGLNEGVRKALGYGLSYAFWPGLLIGGCGLLLTCAVRGGLATLRHYIIRLLLWRTFPLNAPQFLDDATAHALLVHSGGGYSFIHRLLFDYFVSWDTMSAQDL